MILSPSTPSQVDAAASKRVNSTVTTYQPGEDVPIQIVVDVPQSARKDLEVVFVVDASNSISPNITDFRNQVTAFNTWAAANYPGDVKIGVISFGRELSHDAFSNDPWVRYHTRSSGGQFCNSPTYDLNPRPAHFCGALTSVNTSAEAVSLNTRINSELLAYDIQAGFSDITEGIRRGNALFTTGGNKQRIMVLLTDGYFNMSANTQSGYNGRCMLYVGAGHSKNPDTAAVGSIRFNDMVVVHGTASSQYNDPMPKTVSGLGSYQHPCYDYFNVLGIGSGNYPTGKQFLNDHIQPAFGATTTTATNVVNNLRDRLPVTIRFKDVVNTSIFNNTSGATINNIALHNCTSTTGGGAPKYATHNLTASGRVISGVIPVRSGVTKYCIRFTARVASVPGETGSGLTINSVTHQPANCSTASYFSNTNIIEYVNENGEVIVCDTIEDGSVTIQANPNLTAQNFKLTGASKDSANKVFLTTDNIVASGDSVNLSNFIATSSTHAFYAHRTATTTKGAGATATASDTSNYAASGASGDRKSYTRNLNTRPAGNYSAQFFVNYNESPTETSYTNNYQNYTYSVIGAPTGGSVTNLLCTTATLDWRHGANISSYTVRLSAAGSASAVTSSGSTRRTNLTGLTPNTNYTWRLDANALRGTAENVLSGTFRTPTCPSFTVSTDGIIAIAKNGSAEGIMDVHLTYTNDGNGKTWQDYVNAHGTSPTIHINTIHITNGNYNCNALTPNRAVYSGSFNGLTSRVSGTSSAGGSVVWNASTKSFTIRVTSGTGTGQYTVCYGAYTNTSWVNPSGRVAKALINVELRPWVQIARPSSFTSSLVGDAHSNNRFNIAIPDGHHFFKDGVAGVVSAAGPIDFAASRTSSIINKIWRVPQYTPPTTTESYTQLYEKARALQLDPSAEIPGGLPAHNTINPQCAQGGGVFLHNPSANGSGTYTISTTIDLGNAPQCSNPSRPRNLVYIIHGNLNVNANIIDPTTNTTITFIVQGDITVAPTVTQLDGVYLFGGQFSSGSRYHTPSGVNDTRLNIRGSLIGLATDSPSANTGAINLQRNLGYGPTSNDNTAAEYIVYQPKYLFLLKDLFGTSTFTWTE